MSKQKTAMMELIDAIKSTDKETYNTLYADGIFDNLLEKEKEQIMNAFDDGCCCADLELKDADIEQYYNETYKQN